MSDDPDEGRDRSSTRQSGASSGRSTPPGNRLVKQAALGLKNLYTRAVERDERVRRENEQFMENIPEDYEAPGNRLLKQAGKGFVKGVTRAATGIRDWAAEDVERGRLARERDERGESLDDGKSQAPVNAWLERAAKGAVARFRQTTLSRQTTRESDVGQDLDTDQKSRDQETSDHDSSLGAAEASTSQPPAEVARSPYEGADWDAFAAQIGSRTPQQPTHQVEPSRNPWAKDLAEQRARDARNPFAALVEKERQERIAAKQEELTAARQGDGERQQDRDKGKGRDDSMSM
jgi:hypothetical protein